MLLFSVLLNVIEAKSENFENHFVQNFHPIFFVVFCLHRLRLLFLFVGVVHSHNRSGKGCNLTKADEQRLVNLPLRVDVHSAKEQHQPTNGQHRGCD